MTSSARTFTVSNESSIIATMRIEERRGGWWRVHTDIPDPTRPGKTLTYAAQRLPYVQKWAAAIMEEHADMARATCDCGTDGNDDPPGSGKFRCGVLAPHGIRIGVRDHEGDDITQDYLVNGV